MRFSPDSKWLASAGDDHTILIWGLDASGGSKSAGNMMQASVFSVWRSHNGVILVVTVVCVAWCDKRVLRASQANRMQAAQCEMRSRTMLLIPAIDNPMMAYAS